MLKKLIRIIHSIIWWTDWAVVVFLGIIFNFVIWPGNRKMSRRYEYFWSWTLMKIGGVRLEINGQENLPKDETVVYMANHQSDLDWPIIFMTIPGQYLFLAKQELFDVPIFGTYLRNQEHIPISRHKIKSSFKTYQKVVDLIRKGNSIVIYPEGTRSYSEKLQKVKPFSFTFLQEAKVRVVPVTIDGSINIIRRGSMLIHPGTIKVNILSPVSFEDLYHLDKKDFSLAAAQRVSQALQKVLEGEEETTPESAKK